jgi:threonine/homoserine/homoserine lactone efflux protein
MGSMTPGTINLSVLRTGLDHKPGVGIRLAAAAAIVEYLYAWVAVTFERMITSNRVVVEHFHLVAAVVMLTLGLVTFFSATKSSVVIEKFNRSGFRRGLVLGVLNPLAMPYWIAATAYFRSQDWIDLDTTTELHLYLLGVSMGVFTLLVLVNFGARALAVVLAKHSLLLKRIPGVIMLLLGAYALVRYVLFYI